MTCSINFSGLRFYVKSRVLACGCKFFNPPFQTYRLFISVWKGIIFLGLLDCSYSHIAYFSISEDHNWMDCCKQFNILATWQWFAMRSFCCWELLRFLHLCVLFVIFMQMSKMIRFWSQMMLFNFLWPFFLSSFGWSQNV